ncbi:MAG: hypothetical protein JF888_13400 [Candidatus Dormibacteraeota bacterium]|uniref:Uncharacterized protein n=1 Tax=Candidatus Dormiibacter inghamiae TaxID=3127013 RepID=A0A934KJY8_9BACT|nr:hypothetical protein [Candidatus Dormibacteraeota bacterium]MBJ7606414.1 hypothetical protein [Candidatus Dormibacteraeota bacterium]
MDDPEQAPGDAVPLEAAHLLAAIRPLPSRTWRLAVQEFTRLPLVAWGVAWVLGYAAVQLLPPWIGLGAFSVLGVAALTLTRRVATPELQTGWEAQFRRCWWALIGVTPLLGLIIEPTPLPTLLLLLGALWGVALLLYAVAITDWALGMVGVTIVGGAAASHVLAGGWPLLCFGVVGGGAMAILGSVRLLRPA